MTQNVPKTGAESIQDEANASLRVSNVIQDNYRLKLDTRPSTRDKKRVVSANQKDKKAISLGRKADGPQHIDPQKTSHQFQKISDILLKSTHISDFVVILDKKDIDEREKQLGLTKGKKSDLESLILRHIDSEKDKRRKSLGKTFLKSNNTSQNEHVGLKHQRTPSHPVAKASNFLDQFKSSRPQPVDPRTVEMERSRSNSQVLPRKKQSLGSQLNYLQISNNSILGDGLGDKWQANKKSKHEKIQEIRTKFGLN